MDKLLSQTIKDISYVKIIELGKNWNEDLGELPDTIEEIHCSENFVFKSTKYPKNLKALYIYEKTKTNSYIPSKLIKKRNTEFSL